MEGLRSRDLRAVAELLADLASVADIEDVARVTLHALDTLVPAMSGYSELDLQAARVVRAVSPHSDGEPEGDDRDAPFWRYLHQHPVCHRLSTDPTVGALRLSDVIATADWHALDLYREVYRPAGVEYLMELALPAPVTRTRRFILERDSRDFSERDRLVLDLLRPHLAAARERVDEPTTDAAAAAHVDVLTSRELEVLRLVARGLTNIEISRCLFVAPSTVRTHLENTFRKLEVGTRTAAVARAFGTVERDT